MILCIAIFLFASISYFMLLLLLLLFVVVVVFLENKCKFAACNWLQISCINTLLLINYNFNSFLICDLL